MRKKVEIYAPYSTRRNERESRYEYMASELAKNGYHVILHLTSFSHVSKTHVHDIGLREVDGYSVQVHDSVSYRRHFGIRRIWYEREMAKAFRAAVHEDSIIILRAPLLFTADILLRKSFIRDRIVIADVIDMWPEVFLNLRCHVLNRIYRMFSMLLIRYRNNFLEKCDMILTVSKDYTDYFRENLRVKIPCYTIYWSHDCNLGKNHNFRDDKVLKILYAGTLGVQYDISGILHLISLAKKYDDIELLIAGSGDSEADVKAACRNVTNAYYLGLVSGEKVKELMVTCDVGLMIYSKDSPVAMPIKFFDYSAHGLYIINSLSSEVSTIIRENDLGININPEDKESLSFALKYIVTNKEIIKKGAKSRIEYSKLYHRKNQYNKLTSYINAIHSLQS